MPSSTDSILGSIRGRIWLAAGTLAALECFCGLGVYLAMSFVGADPLVAVFVAFFALAFVTLVFGWWLAGDVLRPIDSLTLIAKSLERSPNATLPRTTGSAETDELLGTLHRNGRQIQNLIAMMDDVAAGRTDAAHEPLENADKLSASFQKLVARVTDSISAKQELEALRENLAAIEADIAGIRGGRLDVNFRSRHEATDAIAETIRYLANRLDKVVRGVQVSSAGIGSAAAEANRVLRSVTEARDERNAFISRGIAAAGELQAKAGTIVRGVDSAIATFGASVASPQSEDMLAGLSRSAELSSRITESGRKIQKLRSGVAELANVSRTAKEIARKSNLIALNTPLYCEGDGAADAPLDLLVNEVGSLSERSASLCSEIRAVAESLAVEVNDLGTAFQTISTASIESARGSDRAVHLLEEYKTRFAELTAIRGKLAQFITEHAAEQEKITEIATAVASDRSDEQQIREAEQQVRNLIALVEGLKDSVSDLQGGGNKIQLPQNGNGHSAAALPFERTTAIGSMEEN